MIKSWAWHSMPSETVRTALPQITWQRVGDDLSPASGTAALMLLIAIRFMAETRTINSADGNRTVWIADASYDALGQATGLSRSLISQGLKRLLMLELLDSIGSKQKRRYVLASSGSGWFKLPCREIVDRTGVIKPFLAFTMRSKDELHALKLYLYLAAVRDNKAGHSVATYETIRRQTSIPERNIPKAINVLNASGLMARVVRDHSGGDGIHGPNKYFLTGYQSLFAGPSGTGAASAGSDDFLV